MGEVINFRDYQEEITKYKKEDFEKQVSTSYKGKNNAKYNNPCISKKVE